MTQLVNKAYIYKYPTSIAGCNMTNTNITLADIPASEYIYDPSTYDLAAHRRTGIDALYDVSYQWMAAIGCTIVVIVGLAVSCCTGKHIQLCFLLLPISEKSS